MILHQDSDGRSRRKKRFSFNKKPEPVSEISRGKKSGSCDSLDVKIPKIKKKKKKKHGESARKERKTEEALKPLKEEEKDEGGNEADDAGPTNATPLEEADGTQKKWKPASSKQQIVHSARSAALLEELDRVEKEIVREAEGDGAAEQEKEIIQEQRQDEDSETAIQSVQLELERMEQEKQELLEELARMKECLRLMDKTKDEEAKSPIGSERNLSQGEEKLLIGGEDIAVKYSGRPALWEEIDESEIQYDDRDENSILGSGSFGTGNFIVVLFTILLLFSVLFSALVPLPPPLLFSRACSHLTLG